MNNDCYKYIPVHEILSIAKHKQYEQQHNYLWEIKLTKILAGSAINKYMLKLFSSAMCS